MHSCRRLDFCDSPSRLQSITQLIIQQKKKRKYHKGLQEQYVHHRQRQDRLNLMEHGSCFGEKEFHYVNSRPCGTHSRCQMYHQICEWHSDFPSPWLHLKLVLHAASESEISFKHHSTSEPRDASELNKNSH